MNRHRALAYCLGMIFSENRFTLFRIMPWRSISGSVPRSSPCARAQRTAPGAGARRTREMTETGRLLDTACQRDADVSGIGDAAGGTHHRARDLAVVDADRDGLAVTAFGAGGGDVDAPRAVKGRGGGDRRSGNWRDQSERDARGDKGFVEISHDGPLCFDTGIVAGRGFQSCDG